MIFSDCDNMHLIHHSPPAHLSIVNIKKSKSFIKNAGLETPKSYLLVHVQNGTDNCTEGITLAQIPVPWEWYLCKLM